MLVYRRVYPHLWINWLAYSHEVCLQISGQTPEKYPQTNDETFYNILQQSINTLIQSVKINQFLVHIDLKIYEPHGN